MYVYEAWGVMGDVEYLFERALSGKAPFTFVYKEFAKN